MNNDDLGLLYQVIDLEVISLCDGQWHGIRDFRRDSPTDRPDAGNCNDGTRQDIRENGTATHCSHEFSPLSKSLFRALQEATTSAVKSLALCNASSYPTPFEAHLTCTHLNSNCLTDQSGYSSGEIRVFSYQLARKTSASYGRSPPAVLIAVPASTLLCGLIAHDGATPRAVSLSSSSP
jgi:hypothetical protein